MDKLFAISVDKYLEGKTFTVFRPASLDRPHSNAVMFVTKGFISKAKILETVTSCLVFWTNEISVPKIIIEQHAVILCENPRLEYCRFFNDNAITNHPKPSEYEIVNGVVIEKGAIIGHNAVIYPQVYISAEAIIGDNVLIGSGTRIVGRVKIGNDVVIRENTVIGADGLTIDRDKNGKAVTMPQFGGVRIGNGVSIGSNTVIARGAIDDTVIESGCKIDNSCFISHNVNLGEDTFVVGETIMCGSSSTGKRVLVSGNVTTRTGTHIGDDVIVGMGSVVTAPVDDNTIVYGNPAKMK